MLQNRETLKRIAYLALLTSCLFSVSGQLLMKWVAGGGAEAGLSGTFLLHLGLALSVYTLGVMSWMVALTTVKLSVAYPVTSLNYVGILAGSYAFFGERITPTRISGILLIFAGVLLVVLKAPTAAGIGRSAAVKPRMTGTVEGIASQEGCS